MNGLITEAKMRRQSEALGLSGIGRGEGGRVAVAVQVQPQK